MSKFTIDYSGVENVFYKKAYRLSEVKDQLEAVAFDIVKFRDPDRGAELWQIQKADDGEYIVALYQGEVEKTASNWNVVINKSSGYLQVSYKGDPLVRVGSDKLGIPGGELEKVAEYLPGKLGESKKLVKALLNELSPSAKKEVLKKYPELI